MIIRKLEVEKYVTQVIEQGIAQQMVTKQVVELQKSRRLQLLFQDELIYFQLRYIHTQ